eukprot:COSAG02_NODE_22919_length_735_cov_5.772013_1_plen_103_part_00
MSVREERRSVSSKEKEVEGTVVRRTGSPASSENQDQNYIVGTLQSILGTATILRMLRIRVGPKSGVPRRVQKFSLLSRRLTNSHQPAVCFARQLRYMTYAEA